jgi:hypothetical protein
VGVISITTVNRLPGGSILDRSTKNLCQERMKREQEIRRCKNLCQERRKQKDRR